MADQQRSLRNTTVLDVVKLRWHTHQPGFVKLAQARTCGASIETSVIGPSGSCQCRATVQLMVAELLRAADVHNLRKQRHLESELRTYV